MRALALYLVNKGFIHPKWNNPPVVVVQGLNFQLSAVLLSLGVYSYIEHG